MNKRICYFDFDSTLVESVPTLISTYVYIHYQEIMSGMIPTPYPWLARRWDVRDELPLTDLNEIESLFCHPDFFNRLPFISDPNGLSMYFLFKALYTKHKDDLIVKICSKGLPENLRLKKQYLKIHMPWFDVENDFIPMEGTVMDKSSLPKGFLLADDSASNLLSVEGVVEHKILFAHRGERCEWNEAVFDNEKYNRCDSVAELHEKLAEILWGI